MAFDLKYGKVTTEHGDFADDEVVVIFRSRDRLLPQLLKDYAELCRAHGSPDHHIALVEQVALPAVLDWQAKHETRIPASDDHVERIRREHPF